MIPIYSDQKIIENSLSVSCDVATKVLAVYRKEYRDEGLQLLDKYTIPTMYLIKKLSRDTLTSEELLMEMFSKEKRKLNE